MLLGEIALSMYEASTRPKGRPLRERMEGVEVSIGPDVPGPGDASDPRAALAQAIIAAGQPRVLDGDDGLGAKFCASLICLSPKGQTSRR